MILRIKNGNGKIRLGSGLLESTYSFGTRFEHERGTNPEELIAAAHSSCYAMQLSALIAEAGGTATADTSDVATTTGAEGKPHRTKETPASWDLRHRTTSGISTNPRAEGQHGMHSSMTKANCRRIQQE